MWPTGEPSLAISSAGEVGRSILARFHAFGENLGENVARGQRAKVTSYRGLEAFTAEKFHTRT